MDAELGASLGIGRVPAGTYLATGAEQVPIAGTFEHPDDGRDATLSGAALGIAADQNAFDSCWVRFWPPAGNPLELLSIPVTANHGASEAVQWNSSLGRIFNPPEAFHALPLTELTIAAAAISAVLALTSVRLRRLELASARHIGVTGPDLVGVTLAETTIWLVPACVIALSTFAFLAAWQNPDPLLAAWFAGARVVGAAAAAWWITAGIATALIREAHLVRYFQQR
ncbi:hypothetical protein CQ018_08790 [Arthrobacter sp. MYb227]|uniref:hypothetical protein n=1 Tax=Arthrobacter sp. MYb227 TaxID=1848601 RepID=UPI000CFC3D5E|nr:hypothetical protein [Arthrobacter sp. MYb227]PQZ93741.1 hypothetical protein CQ018_08790 [Arthrobacter sp. MYb227]